MKKENNTVTSSDMHIEYTHNVWKWKLIDNKKWMYGKRIYMELGERDYKIVDVER